MIKNITIVVRKHSDVVEVDISRIIALKGQHWKYSVDSQKEWIGNNIHDADYHLWLENETGKILAYLNVVNLKAQTNTIGKAMLGIGNVCVDLKLKRTGLGSLLMSACRYFLGNLGLPSILLCKDYLLDFYKKAGWSEFHGTVTIDNKEYVGCLMTSDDLNTSAIALDRPF